MKTIYLAVFTLLFFACHAQNKSADDQQKPPAIFVLSINGKEYDIKEGQELKLGESFKSPTISVKMAAYRKFDNGNFSFNYKSNSNYQYSETEGNKTWTFDGGDCTILLFDLAVKVKLDAILDNVTAQFGKENCKTEPAERKIGDKVYTGKQINVNLAGQKLVQEYYEITLDDTNTYIIAFQNLRKDDGTLSEDGKAGEDMVASSFKLVRSR